MVDELVTEKPDRAAAEPRQFRQRHRPVTRHYLFHDLQRVALELDARGLAAFAHDDGAAVLHERDARVRADEGIAADVLAALDGLEQERRAFAAQLLVGRDRRFQIGQQLAVNRNEVTAAR